MKKFVTIQSNITIVVTPGLQHQNFTKLDSDIPDRMKISAIWPKATVLIKAGQHTYPSEIKNWKTVKALERDGLLTIGAETDDATNAAELLQTKAQLNRELKDKTDISLSDIAKE